MSITLDDVQAAAERLQGVANRTPVFTSRTLDGLVGSPVHLKAESFQRGGAFKFRGAYNRIAGRPAADGVLAYSSGNHAQAVALAARLLGLRATILMPEDAAPVKLAATRGYGAEIVTYDRWSDDREALGSALATERGLDLVRPYDDPLVMAGQGTTALELLADVPGARGARDAGGRKAGCSPAARQPRRLSAPRCASSVSSRRLEMTPRCRSQQGSASTSACRARSPTGFRRRSPAS